MNESLVLNFGNYTPFKELYKIVRKIRSFITLYGAVTIGDVYDIVDSFCYNVVSKERDPFYYLYGWKDLSGSKVKITVKKSCFLLSLPEITFFKYLD